MKNYWITARLRKKLKKIIIDFLIISYKNPKTMCSKLNSQTPCTVPKTVTNSLMHCKSEPTKLGTNNNVSGNYVASGTGQHENRNKDDEFVVFCWSSFVDDSTGDWEYRDSDNCL